MPPEGPGDAVAHAESSASLSVGAVVHFSVPSRGVASPSGAVNHITDPSLERISPKGAEAAVHDEAPEEARALASLDM